MLLLSWLAGVPLPVAAAVFDMGKRGRAMENTIMNHCCGVHGFRDFRISLQVSDIWEIGRFDVLAELFIFWRTRCLYR